MTRDTTKADLLQHVDDLIGGELREVEALYHSELESSNPYVSDILTQASRFRGKRLRPVLLLLTASAVGEIRREHKVLAAVVEMIHTATLVHDDVLDEAETRRHVATVNARWNTETSVLFGDYLFTHAFHLASSLDSTIACRLIGRSTNIICEGELTQIRERGNVDLSEDAYLRIIEGKTAELCALCCRLGALFANADDDVINVTSDYGRALGMAFQIADDILDLTGTEPETGKTLGSDFVQQKLTLPMIRLLATASERERAALREMLLCGNAEGEARLHRRLVKSDAMQYARNRALEFAETARKKLSVLPVSTGRRILEEATDFAALRTF